MIPYQPLALQSNFTVGYPARKTIPRDIMGEAPRARNTAQNTLTTWHADRLYGAMVIIACLMKTGINSYTPNREISS